MSEDFPIKLQAVHSEAGTQPQHFNLRSLEAAAEFVEELERNGAWPEGHDAVATNTFTNERWMYVDGWEKL